MAITTLDGALAGMQPPQLFTKAVGGTMVAGRAHSFWTIAGIPSAGAVVGTNIAITSCSTDATCLVTTAAHGYASTDTVTVSISGVAGSTPAVDGQYQITYVGATSFTIPLTLTVAGTGGVCCALPSTTGTRTAGLAGEVLTATRNGQVPFTNPVSGNTYLAKFQAAATIPGTLILADRLWQNCGIHPTITSEQLFTNALPIPARDANGTTDGVGVYAMVECQTALGNGTPTYTLKYTNSAGTAGKTATNIMATANGPTVGDCYIFGLAAGDVGIQKVESFTASGTSTSGTMGIVLFRPIAQVECMAAYVPNAIDALTGGFPRIYDNSVPFFIFIPNTTTTSNILGQVIYSQG